MEKTYTYTARSAEYPEQVVTFTLHDTHMSVGLGAPLEHLERALHIGEEEEAPEEEGGEAEGAEEAQEDLSLWLKPMAVSLVERGTRPFRVDDVAAQAADDWLQVKAWVRTGGLRLMPITLIDGRVDNPAAAHAFVEEVAERKATTGPNLLGLLDYWATWFVAGFLMVVLFQLWRRRGKSEA